MKQAASHIGRQIYPRWIRSSETTVFAKWRSWAGRGELRNVVVVGDSQVRSRYHVQVVCCVAVLCCRPLVQADATPMITFLKFSPCPSQVLVYGLRSLGPHPRFHIYRLLRCSTTFFLGNASFAATRTAAAKQVSKCASCPQNVLRIRFAAPLKASTLALDGR